MPWIDGLGFGPTGIPLKRQPRRTIFALEVIKYLSALMDLQWLVADSAGYLFLRGVFPGVEACFPATLIALIRLHKVTNSFDRA